MPPNMGVLALRLSRNNVLQLDYHTRSFDAVVWSPAESALSPRGWLVLPVSAASGS